MQEEVTRPSQDNLQSKVLETGEIAEGHTFQASARIDARLSGWRQSHLNLLY